MAPENVRLPDSSPSNGGLALFLSHWKSLRPKTQLLHFLGSSISLLLSLIMTFLVMFLPLPLSHVPELVSKQLPVSPVSYSHPLFLQACP